MLPSVLPVIDVLVVRYHIRLLRYKYILYVYIYMSDKDKTINDVYYDRAGFGSQRVTYLDAKKKDPSITMQDVKDWFSENIDRKSQLSGYNSFVAPEANYEYQLDLSSIYFSQRSEEPTV